MITGIDISHHNQKQFEKGGSSWNGFIFLKATEGKTLEDKCFKEYLKNLAFEFEVNQNSCFLGAYHYARPENNDYRDEAKHFLDVVGAHAENMMLALDYEETAHKYGERWALGWLSYVKKQTGKSPIFYTSAAYMKNYPTIVTEYPLWISCYSQDSRTGRYKDICDRAAFLQITSNPIDVDVFKGTAVELASYIKGGAR